MAAATVMNIEAHQGAINTPLPALVRSLSELLTRDLTAYIANVSDAGTVSRWAAGKSVNLRPAHEQRLRLAFEIVQLFRAFESSDRTIRAWFIGLNPHLDDDPPAEAIHDGRLKEALAAARAFVAGSY